MSFLILAEATGPVVHWWEEFPGLMGLIYFLAGAVLIALIVRYIRGSTATPGSFLIGVAGGDIQFSGRFPAHMQMIVAEFLRNDVAIQEPYEVRGRWDGSTLIVVVKGDAARGMEQRIRNFLKLNLKRP